jgi:energy-coupling factor transporter ATP-binding protein EcfA2
MTEVLAEEMVLDVKNLQTVFFTSSGLFKAVDDLSFTVRRGETLAIVGESGCGKSVSALSIMRLVPDPPGRIVGGSVTLEGTDLLGLNEAEMRKIRDDFPGADDLAQSGNADRRPDHRSSAPAPRYDEERGVDAGSRDAASGPDSRTGTARPGISAPAFRRHAPARDDRDGAGVPAGAVDCG